MNNIVLVDCSTEATKIVSGFMADNISLSNQAYDDNLVLTDARMIFFQVQSALGDAAIHISKIRKACNFKAIPIIAISEAEDVNTIDQLLGAGASEVISLSAPPAACRQIIQGHLIPNRKPLENEKAYLDPFIENTVTVLKKMAFVDAEFREIYFMDDMRVFGDISGIIGLSGNSEGTVAITFYWDLARKVIANMMRVTEDKINAEFIHDGAGELINMISGSTKKVFKGTQYHFELSLPTVVVGSGHHLGHPEGASIAVLIFNVGQSAFALQVCLKTRQKSADTE